MLVSSLFGCATSRKGMLDIKTQQLEMKVRELERDVQQKDKEIYELENELELARRDLNKITRVKIYPEKKIVATKEEVIASKSTPKRIQIALKKAGFYNGAIDGKIGKNTKNAIKEFQEKNGLKADGVVGKKTWAELSKYLQYCPKDGTGLKVKQR